MKLGLAQYTSVEIDNHEKMITKFSDDIEKYFFNKNYGTDLIDIVIGIVCVSPNFEQFFKPRRPKYTKDKKHIKSEGFEYDIEKCLEYSIKLDFETFKNGTEEECRKLLAREILRSLKVLEDMKGKIKDFNAENFKKDLENYFKEEGLI
jgi:hypothetical protein